MLYFGDKVNFVWFGKWYREVRFEEVFEVVEKYCFGQFWFLVRSLIFYVGVRIFEDVVRLLNFVIGFGFKYFNIKSVSYKKLVVEICLIERMDVLLGENGELWVDEVYIEKIVNLVNVQVRRFKGKLKRLEEEIEKFQED